MNPKVIALYLPQFYKVPENDYWWGEGFTDWISAKNAVPMFDGHYQPHLPYDDYYYNLLDKGTMQWQSNLMREYGIDGLCFYHYWFGDDKKMLEKPAENLLNWKDIDMPFCFCWANMSWARSWAKLSGMDYWIGTEDEKTRQNGKGLLIKQLYGGEDEWKHHFDYLLSFFKDDRYIKIDGKPVLWIYRMDLIQNSASMFKFMQDLAEQNGLEGIYFIGSFYQPEKRDGLDAAVIYEPGEVLPDVTNTTIGDNEIKIYDYDKYWKESIRRDYADIKTYYTGLVNYDSTARQGIKGEVISGSPERFEYWLKVLLKKSVKKNNELVFLNAWNEWGEGNHLEPDQKYGFAYLEAIQNAKHDFKETSLDDFCFELYGDRTLGKINSIKCLNHRMQANLSILESWMKLYQRGISITDSNVIKGKSHVAIYGYGVLGKLIVSELLQSNIKIDYIVDKCKVQSEYEIQVYSPEEDLPHTELIIVTIASGYEEVLDILDKKGISSSVLIGEVIRSL